MPTPTPAPSPGPSPPPPATPPVPTYTFPRANAVPDTAAAGGFRFSTLTDQQFMAAKAGHERATYETNNFRQYAPAVTTVGGRFVTDNHLDAIKASAAYARGATGAGETVVIADSGFYQEHREFSGDNKFTLGASFGAPCTDAEIRSRACSGPDHGTSTAGVAAARRARESTWPNTQGVAFDANIIGLRVRLGAGRPTTRTEPPMLTDDGDMETVEFYERLLYQPVDSSLPQAMWTYDRNNPRPGFVINMSFGLPYGIDSYTRADVRANRDRTANLFAQAHRDAADRTILVWSAGNQNNRRYAPRPGAAQGQLVDATSPTLNTALGVHFDLPHVLVVVSVQQNGIIASSSNRCGSAKAFCIAAPGVDLIAPQRGEGESSSLGGTTYQTNAYRTFSGTSAAAPVVTGALAVMRSFFRNPGDGTPALGNTELVARLLATADRADRRGEGRGDYSDSDTYGHGLVDLDAATRPAGMLMTSMNGGGESAGDISLSTVGGAFGNGIAETLGGATVALFDQLNAPFFTTAGQWLRRPGGRNGALGGGTADSGDGHATFTLAAAGDWLQHARFTVDNGDSGWWTGWNGVENGAPWLDLVGDGPGGGFASGGFAVAVQHGAPLAEGRPVDAAWRDGTAITMHWRALRLGLLREAEGVLGARPGGAMGRASATTAFAGAGWNWRLGRWHGAAAAHLGATSPQTTPGLLQNVSHLTSDAYTLSAARRGLFQSADTLTLSLAQPLRVRAGRAAFRLPAGRTRYGQIIHQTHDISLKPAGRAVELKAAWRGRLGAGNGVGLTLTATRQPNHDARAELGREAWVGFWGRF